MASQVYGIHGIIELTFDHLSYMRAGDGYVRRITNKGLGVGSYIYLRFCFLQENKEVKTEMQREAT